MDAVGGAASAGDPARALPPAAPVGGQPLSAAAAALGGEGGNGAAADDGGAGSGPGTPSAPSPAPLSPDPPLAPLPAITHRAPSETHSDRSATSARSLLRADVLDAAVGRAAASGDDRSLSMSPPSVPSASFSDNSVGSADAGARARQASMASEASLHSAHSLSTTDSSADASTPNTNASNSLSHSVGSASHSLFSIPHRPSPVPVPHPGGGTPARDPGSSAESISSTGSGSVSALPIFPPFISMTLDTIIDAVIVANGRGLILEFNRAAVNMFGWSKEEVIGIKPLNILMPQRYSKHHDRYMSEYRNGGTPKLIGVTRTLRGLRKDGTQFPVDVSLGQFPKEWLANLRDDEMERYLAGGLFVGTLRDVTQKHKEMEQWGQTSRYAKEFEEMEFLGKGGFGAVYRSRNRLDGQEYAIKKIRLKCHPADYAMAMSALQSSSNINQSAMGNHVGGGSTASGSTGTGHGGAEASVGSAGSGSAGGSASAGSVESEKRPSKTGSATDTAGTNATGAQMPAGSGSLSPDDLRIIREVKTFARISNHPNVVRYYNSWVEAVWDEDGDKRGSSSSEEREKGAGGRERRPGTPDRGKPAEAAPPPPPAPASVPGPENAPAIPVPPPAARPPAEEEGDTIELSAPGGLAAADMSAGELAAEEVSRNFYTPQQMRSIQDIMRNRRQFPVGDRRPPPAVPGAPAAAPAAAAAMPAPQVKVVLRNDASFEAVDNSAPALNPAVVAAAAAGRDVDVSSDTTGTTNDSAEMSLAGMPAAAAKGKERDLPRPPPPPPGRPAAAVLEQPAPRPTPPPVPARASVAPPIRVPSANERAPSRASRKEDKDKERRKRDRSGDRRTEASTILFIQMQLCSPSNLHKWLQARNGARSVVVDPQTNLQIFRQICSGLAHVHNGGFIHRDIKPANVFLEGDHVFLGDFGLAKDISQRARHGGDQDAEDAREFWNEMVVRTDDGSGSESGAEASGSVVLKEGWEDTFARKLAEEEKKDHPNLNVTQTNLTLGVGTLLYASPEQLSRRRYDSKTDIYSLGVLFFELYYPFASAVERVYTLMELRKGVVPHSFRARYPSEWMLLRRMIAHDPKDRPTANEIMVCDLLRDHEAAMYRRSNTTPSLGSSRGQPGERKRASSATGDLGNASISSSRSTAGSSMRGRSAGRTARFAGSPTAERSRGRREHEQSSSRLRTEVGELIVGETSSSSGLSKPHTGTSHSHSHSHSGSGSARKSSATSSGAGRLADLSSVSMRSEDRSESTTSTETTDSEDFADGDDFDDSAAGDFGVGGRTHEDERRRINAARLAAMRRRSEAAAVRPCPECGEKDIMILALRERNRKLMDRVHELERELQLARSGGASAALGPAALDPPRGGLPAAPPPTRDLWGLGGGRAPPEVPARPAAPGTFPRAGPSGFPRPLGALPLARAGSFQGPDPQPPSPGGIVPGIARPPSAPPPFAGGTLPSALPVPTPASPGPAIPVPPPALGPAIPVPPRARPPVPDRPAVSERPPVPGRPTVPPRP